MRKLVVFTTHPIQYQAPWFRALSQVAGLEVEVVYSYRPGAAEQGVGFGTDITWDIPLLDGYRHRTLETLELPDRVPGLVRRWARGLSCALDAIKPDAALVLGWQEVSLVQAILACRRRGIPVILRGESNALKSRAKWISGLHRRLFALCDGFLAIGSANARLYREAGVDAERILTAGYCVDNERFRAEASRLRPERTAIRAHWSIADDATCFVFVGKLEPKKHVGTFLDGVARARAGGANVCGLVVGSGVQQDEARAFVAAHRLPVTFAGFLNQGEIARAYVAADALVLPSDFGETWGLVVNEGMATGLPVIVSDRVGCAHDLVLHGETGLVVAFADGEAFGAAMRQLADDAGVRKAMGSRAAAWLQAHFSIDGAVARTLEMLDKVHPRAEA